LDYYGTSPVVNVSIQCLEITGADTTIYQTVSDINGLYEVLLPPATYYVCANGNTNESLYEPCYLGGTNYSSYSTTVTVEVDDNINSVNFYLYSGYHFRGNVTYQGAPIEADIIAYDNTTGSLFYGLTGTKSGPDGTFNLTVPQGVYVITAYASGHIQPAQLPYVIINDDIDTTELIQLEIPPTADVSGIVSGPGDEFISGVRVDAFDVSMMYTYSYGYTNESGQYTITGLEVGRTYKLLCRTNFHAEGSYGTLPGTWYPNNTDPKTATEVTVTSAGLTGADITLDANGGSITGLVTDTTGTPIENAYVYDFYFPDTLINPYSAIAQRTIYTGTDGRYTLLGVAGTVGVAVIADGYVPQIYSEHNMTTLLNTGNPLTINPGDSVSDINFRLTDIDKLGAAPSVFSISPHLIIKNKNLSITITGTSFDPAASVNVVDFYPFYVNGDLPTISNIQISSEEIQLTISTNTNTSTGAFYLAITNPDGQYTMTGFVIIEPESGPTLNILAAPETFLPASTLTLGSNTSNLSSHPVSVDGYMGLVLPTGEAIFFDGTTFSMDLIKYFDNVTLESGYFDRQNLEFEIPLDGTVLPPGEYLWFAGLFQPGTWDLIDLTTQTIMGK